GYRVLSKLASYWAETDHLVEILVNHSSGEPYFPTSARIRWLDDWGRPVKHSAFHQLGSRKGVKHVHYTLRSLWFGLSRIPRDANVILANHSLTAWPVFLANSRAQKFYYIQAYEPEYYSGTAQGRKRILEFAAWLTYFFPLQRIVNSPIY